MTLFDLECFLKRDGNPKITLYRKNGKFKCFIDGAACVTGESSTIAQAIDNAMIELRTAPGKRPDTQPPPIKSLSSQSIASALAKAFGNNPFATSTAPVVSSAPAPTGIDPNAAKRARAMTYNQALAKARHGLAVGDVCFFDALGQYKEWDGSAWVDLP